MARLSVVASLFAILPLPPSRFRPLAPYCPITWHLTTENPPQAGTLLLPPPQRLASYCYSPAGTLLLLVVGWHPLGSVAPLALSPSDRSALPWLRLVVV